MKCFEREKELLIDYFKTTPVILIIFDLIAPILSTIGTIYGYIDSNTPILLATFVLVVLFFLIKIHRIKKTCINIKSLYLDEDTFLSHMITNITEVRRFKEKDKINDVNVEKIDMNFQINEPNPNNSVQSDMDVTWKIHCKTLENELLNYHLLCSKSESKRGFNPQIKIREFTGTYSATITNLSNGLINHISLSFRNGKLLSHSDFELEIILEKYYRFMWNDCEVLLINAAMFGNSVEKIRATILFKDSRIANKNISVYEVNPNNFSRLLVQQSPCQPCTNGTGYIYCFEYNKKSSNKFFIIAIPKN